MSREVSISADCRDCEGEFEVELTVHHGAELDLNHSELFATCPECAESKRLASKKEELGDLEMRERRAA